MTANVCIYGNSGIKRKIQHLHFLPWTIDYVHISLCMIQGEINAISRLDES